MIACQVIIQAKVGVKVLARERIAPYRKDVLIKSGKLVGGGDSSRKKKLLEKQKVGGDITFAFVFAVHQTTSDTWNHVTCLAKAGKARSKSVGRVELSQEAFWSVLKR